MWCRFSLFFCCCLVAVTYTSARDEDYGGSRNQGSRSPIASGSGTGWEGQSNSGKLSTAAAAEGNQGSRNEGRSSDSQKNYEQEDTSTPRYNMKEGVPFGRPNSNSGNMGSRAPYGEEHSSGRPTGESNNRENNYSSTGFTHNNNQHSSRSAGGSTHNSGNENRPSRPGYEGQPTGRPLGSSNNRPGSGSDSFSSLPGGESSHGQSNEYRPDREKEHLSGRPTGGSSHIGGQQGFRPSEFRPDNFGENPNSRPTGGSSTTSNHNEGINRPGVLKPNNGMEQFGRPSGESVHSQQSEFRPTDHEGQSGHLPTESTLGQFTTSRPSEQKGGSNNKSTENDSKDEGKEDEKDVCFPNLGCFKMGKPWKSVLRPIGPPHGPERIQTTIHFYSRENLEKPKNITVYPQINMGEARFDPRKITAMIVHGFSNSGNATWMKDMKNVYLKKVDANLMIVDWGNGARLLNYFQVAGNTRVVGKQLGLFIKYLRENYGADPGKFHLIGHSLGAQICSYLGKEVPGIARLTALDPAQPGFEGFDAELRLDKNDAEFVDVVHTDARPFIPTLGFGMITPHGHVDFYMNGGYDQPGCVPPPKKELPSVKSILDLAKFPVEVIAKAVACPHARAYEYLIEAFNETEKCIFWGHKADVKNVLMSVTNTVTQGLLKKFTALSSTCSKEDCIPLGFATKKSPLRGVFVVTTGSRSPYCISEPGIPPETLPQERKQESFIQKIGKKTGLSG